jgi:hypothetical protein
MVLLLSLFVAGESPAAGFAERFIDPEDGFLDTSEWLSTRRGFLPVPIVITEPAVGYGGGLALTFFHGQFGGVPAESGTAGSHRRVPPSVSAVAAGGTENGTWFAGGGHLGIWRQDRIRYLGGGGYADANLDYYGSSGQLKRPVSFNSKVLGLVQELSFRLGESNFFAGLGYRLVDTSNSFDFSSAVPVPGIPALKFDSRSAGVTLTFNYDDRDNIFTPSSGMDAEIKLGNFGSTWGGDDDFNEYSAYLKNYSSLGGSWILGLRLDGKAVDGNAPFYEYPFVEMRGIKVMRYQGEKVVLGEVELRWMFHPRWALVGFAGGARTWSGERDAGSERIYSRGLGFRYLVARKLGLQVGLDIARGPEDTAFYIQVGSAWLR